MFALFFNLYLAMFRGRWIQWDLTDIKNGLIPAFNEIGQFITSLFNNVNTPMSTFGNVLLSTQDIGGNQFITWMGLLAFVLATITSIGIVVMAVKGVKKAFGIFFMGIR